MGGAIFNAIGEDVGRTVAEWVRAELGGHLLAAAIYGSVAHDAAGADSDVELIVPNH